MCDIKVTPSQNNTYILLNLKNISILSNIYQLPEHPQVIYIIKIIVCINVLTLSRS